MVGRHQVCSSVFAGRGDPARSGGCGRWKVWSWQHVSAASKHLGVDVWLQLGHHQVVVCFFKSEPHLEAPLPCHPDKPR